MGIGVSIFLVAVGAILAFAVDVTAQGVDLNTIGVILMIVGAVGLLVSSLFLASFSPFRSEVRQRDVIDREPDRVIEHRRSA